MGTAKKGVSRGSEEMQRVAIPPALPAHRHHGLHMKSGFEVRPLLAIELRR
jgi:hypothetical protein